MIIKVCGMREPENIRAVEACGPDWMGFILSPCSPRYVAAPPPYLPAPPVRRVGVFVNPTIEDVVRQTQTLRLDLIQLHGSEPPRLCLAVKQATHLPVIKALSIAAPGDLACADSYLACADYLLFDTKTHLPGGSGQTFDWTLLDNYRGTLPFLLSGGIAPEDLSRILAYRHPRCIGIDLNSRFETAPAHKDPCLLAPFIAALRTLTTHP